MFRTKMAMQGIIDKLTAGIAQIQVTASEGLDSIQIWRIRSPPAIEISRLST